MLGFGPATSTVLAFHEALHVTIIEIGVQVRFGVQVAVAGEHLPGQPVAAHGAEPNQEWILPINGVVWVLRRCAGEQRLRLIHVSKQEQQTGLIGMLGWRTSDSQPLQGRGDPFGFALGEAAGSESLAGQKFGAGRPRP